MMFCQYIAFCTRLYAMKGLHTRHDFDTFTIIRPYAGVRQVT
jgi:hypothetical protein